MKVKLYKRKGLNELKDGKVSSTETHGQLIGKGCLQAGLLQVRFTIEDE